MSSEWLDVMQVAERLKVSRRTVMNLIKSGDLEGFKVGREWRFTEADISEYQDRQRRKAEIEKAIRNLNKKSSAEEGKRPLVNDVEFPHKAKHLVLG